MGWVWRSSAPQQLLRWCFKHRSPPESWLWPKRGRVLSYRCDAFTKIQVRFTARGTLFHILPYRKAQTRVSKMTVAGCWCFPFALDSHLTFQHQNTSMPDSHFSEVGYSPTVACGQRSRTP